MNMIPTTICQNPVHFISQCSHSWIRLRCGLLVGLLLLVGAGVSAQIRGNSITISIQPDHRDWNYRVGEEAHFKVQVLRSGTTVPDAVVNVEAGPEKYLNEKREGVRLKDGEMIWKGRLDHPGFYRLWVRTTIGQKNYEDLCTVSFSPEKLRADTQCPKDFDEFWGNALREARQTSLEPTRRLLPERSTEAVNTYEVSFQNNKWNSRIYGILCVPTKPGKYPALLRVPGAGVRPYQGDPWTAAKGVITLEIGIHGIPVTMEQEVYDRLLSGALDGYWETNLDNPKRNYYYRVVTGAVRSVDYIASLPEWDGRKIGVTGSSQGGFLSLAVAALDKRITCLGVVHDAMCDYEKELHVVAGGWPHYFYQQKNADARRIEGARYYDGVNFARRVTAPGWYSFGYNDVVVPPTASYATYNEVKAPKQLSVYPQTGHFLFQEQWDEWQAWLMSQLLGK